MWQSLYAANKSRDFVVIAVALDVQEAARPWIDAAKPDYPCLIDRDHALADLYGITNVPQAVWLDERGRIVRPPENAGSSDAFRGMDRVTKQMSAGQIEERQRIKSVYVAALQDWINSGAASKFVCTADEARARLHLPNADTTRAHAHFRIAQHLLAQGRAEEAQKHFGEASRLHPDSWNIWRQGAEKDATGTAISAEFWTRVDALGDRPYHRKIEMEGI